MSSTPNLDVRPAKAPRSVAERMRLHRRRRRLRRRLVQIEVDAIEIDALVARGYLDAKDRDNLRALEEAANAAFSDALVTP
jgi:hypothetical protein